MCGSGRNNSALFRVETDASETIHGFEAWFVAHLVDEFWISVLCKSPAEEEGTRDMASNHGITSVTFQYKQVMFPEQALCPSVRYPSITGAHSVCTSTLTTKIA